jgi:hypothetical protein
MLIKSRMTWMAGMAGEGAGKKMQEERMKQKWLGLE